MPVLQRTRPAKPGNSPYVLFDSLIQVELPENLPVENALGGALVRNESNLVYLPVIEGGSSRCAGLVGGSARWELKRSIPSATASVRIKRAKGSCAR